MMGMVLGKILLGPGSGKILRNVGPKIVLELDSFPVSERNVQMSGFGDRPSLRLRN